MNSIINQESLKRAYSIVRREAIEEVIENACEWLYMRQSVDLVVPNIDKFVEDFRKAMTGGNN